MKVENVVEKDLKREYNVVVPANDIDEKINTKLQSISKTVKVPGFRPGKVPLNIVKNKYGKDVMGEVLQDVVAETSRNALEEKKIRPAYQPKIEITKFDEGADLEYKISLEIMPDVPDLEYDKIKIKKLSADIGDKDIDELISNLAKQQPNFSPISGDRKTKNGDAVLIDFKGFVDGVAFDGGEAQGHQLVLGSNSFIPGFEDQLVGKSKGDDVKVEVKFPEDYHNKELAAADSIFEVKIHDILEEQESEINDDFAKKIGFESLDKLKELVQNQLKSDGEMMSRVLAKKDLFDALDDKLSFDLPEELVESEMKMVVDQLKQSGEKGSKDKPLTEEEIRKEYKYLADRRVKLGLLVTEISVKNNIQIAQDEINKAIMQEAQKYPGQEQQVLEFFQKNPQQQDALKGPILEDKVVDFILEKVNTEEESKPLEEIRNLLQESNEGASPKSKKKDSGKKKVAKSETKSANGGKKKSSAGAKKTASADAKKKTKK